MKKAIRFLFLVSIFGVLGGFLFFSNYGQRGSGISKTEDRQVESFQRIVIEGFGRLNVNSGETQSVEVTIDDDLIDLIETSVSRDGTLLLRPTTALNPKVDLVYDIVVPELTRVELAGAASLQLNDVSADALVIELAGACGAYGSGNVDKLTLELAGACRARLKELQTRVTNVEVAGTGSAEVFASASLNAEASGVASITCYGNPPQVKKEANGISKVSIAGS